MYYLLRHPTNKEFRVVSDTHIGGWYFTMMSAINTFHTNSSIRVFSNLSEYLINEHISLPSLDITEAEIINQYPEFFL